jgi:hypothetical protein
MFPGNRGDRFVERPEPESYTSGTEAEKRPWCTTAGVKDGTVVLDPGVELPEGAVVRVELELAAEPQASSGDDPLSRMADLAVETGIPEAVGAAYLVT